MQEEPSVFTLIELVILLSVCGILGATILPQCTNSKRDLPAEDTRTSEQLAKDNFGVTKVGEIEGCSLYFYTSDLNRHFFVVCHNTCPEVKL